MPHFQKSSLVSLFRKHAKTILDKGGVVRGIENHGIRPLCERSRKKYLASDGSRYFWEARYTSVTFDASPTSLETISRLIKQEEGVIRYFTVKVPSAAERVEATNYKNPYLAGVKDPNGQSLDWEK